MKFFTRIGTSLAMIVATLGVAVCSTSTPAAASTCSGSTCVGRDPVTYGCAATSTKTATAFIGSDAVATVWNRYSLGCNANWARGQLTALGVSRHYTIQVRVWVNAPYQSMCFPGPSNTGSSQENCYPLPGYGGSSMVYTDMVDGSYKTYAAVNVYDGNNLVASAVHDQ
jgi:hypothetical protein